MTMRPISKVLFSCAVLVSALGLSPGVAPGQEPERLVRLDNSSCGSASSVNAALPDSINARLGPRINESPDIVLLASVHADQVRFASKPDIRVRLCWGGDSVRIVERTNLPSPVVPGTTYRDVFINLEILGHVNAACIASRITGTAADSSARGSCGGLAVGLKR